MIYYIIWIVLFAFSFWEINNKHNEKNIILCGKIKKISLKSFIYFDFVFFLIIFCGTRLKIGIDYNTYQDMFSKVKMGMTNFFVEPTFILIANVFKTFNWVLLVYAILSIGLKSVYIKRSSRYIWVSLFLYYSIYFLRLDMGLIRQSVAIGLALLGIFYLGQPRNNKKISICLVMAACLFHYSAIVVLVTFFLYKRKIKFSIMVYSAIAAFVMSFTNFWYYIIKIIFSIFSFLPISKYEAYMYNTSYIYNHFSFGDLRHLIVLFVLIYLVSKFANTKENMLLLKLYYVGTMIFYLFKSFNTLSDRGSVYFTIVEIILLASLLDAFKDVISKNIYMFMVGGYSLYYLCSYVNFTTTSWMNEVYCPYSSWFF